MKKFIVLFMSVLLVAMPLVGCTTAADNIEIETKQLDYEYADYEFDATEPQYYMRSNAAAAEDGYYYITSAPLDTNNNRFIYYFDMINLNAYPLCSKLNCEHTDENCEAYLSDDRCLNRNIWYYDGRIYMIERKAEQDELVSYDKNGRDKKIQAVISADGLSVATGGTMKKACINQGKLYYFMSDETAQYLYEVPLSSNAKPTRIKAYTSEYKVKEWLSLYAIDNKVYINWTSGITENKFNYIVESYDVNSKTLKEEVNCIDDNVTIRGKIDQWNTDIYFDKDGNLYYISLDGGEFILNKLNLTTKENKEIYVLKSEFHVEKETGNQGYVEGKETSDTAYMALKGFDGQYLYVYKGVNASLKIRGQNKPNYMYVLKTDGELADTIVFDINEEHITNKKNKNNSLDYILVDFWGGDSRYILASVQNMHVTGLEADEAMMKKYEELSRQIPVGSSLDVHIIGVCNKNQLTTGQHNWNNVTPK